MSESSTKSSILSSANILAGISVGAYMIPQAMALASLAGVPVSSGLAVAAVPLIVYMFLGRSTYISLGPESTVALMSAAAVAPVTAAFGIPVVNGLAITSILVGVILFVGWLLKASFLADLLSNPILVGYLTGVALLMMMSQLDVILGIPIDGSTPQTLIQSDWSTPNWQTLGLATVVVVTSLVCAKINKRIPGTLLGMGAATLLAVPLDVPKVGEVTLGLTLPTLDGITLEVISALLIPALSISIVAFTDVMVTSRAFAGGKRPDSANEMRSLAVAQAATGLAGGYPMSASSSRTALAFASGATSRFYSIFVVTVLLAGPLIVPGAIAAVPDAALGGVIFYAAITLVNPSEWRALAKFRTSEVVIAAACAFSVVIFGILPGVIIAVAVSITEFMARLARPHEAVLGYVPDMAGMHDVDDRAETETIPGLVVFRYDAPLFFMNAYDFYDKVIVALQPDTEVVLLNMEANVELDTTALDALQDLDEELARRNIDLWLARVKMDVISPLMAHGVGDIIGEHRMYPSLRTGVDEYHRRHPSQA